MKLVLKHNKYFIESAFPEVLQTLLKDRTIQDCRITRSVDEVDKDGLITCIQEKSEALQVSIFFIIHFEISNHFKTEKN